MLRLARHTDAPAIARIFAPYADHTAISFARGALTAPEWETKIAETLAQFPFLVVEERGRVVAYAYASPHRSLHGYRWCCEVSVYVEASHSRRGAAARLYGALLELLRLQRLENAYAGISLPNAASVGLHERFGFRPFAVFRGIGWKLGAWRDVGWWELKLQSEQLCPPPEPLAFAAVQKEQSAVVSRILGP